MTRALALVLVLTLRCPVLLSIDRSVWPATHVLPSTYVVHTNRTIPQVFHDIVTIINVGLDDVARRPAEAVRVPSWMSPSGQFPGWSGADSATSARSGEAFWEPQYCGEELHQHFLWSWPDCILSCIAAWLVSATQ